MKGVIIFSGFNMRALYAFIRTLENNDISYYIIASSNDDEIFKTQYKEKVFSVRNEKSLILQDVIRSINKVQEIAQLEKYFIAPSTEALNRFLLKHRAIFSGLGCTIPLIQKSLYEDISNKYSFGQICEKYGIKTPKEFSVLSFDVPCVAKPKQYCGEVSKQILKPVLILTETQKENFIKTYCLDDFYFQEFIGGKSFYLLYYFYQDGTFLKYSQENLIQQCDGGSILAAKSSTFHCGQYSEPYERLFREINYHGLIMIESKLHQNEVYMIEANPRFWGPSQLFVDAGVNFFNAMLQDYNLLERAPNIVNPVEGDTYYFWNDGESFQAKCIREAVFYNYSKGMFFDELAQWNKVNLLNRPDTLDIYKELV